MQILITGGAGFVGSNLALMFAEAQGASVIALDNLHRRGSELALPRLRAGGVRFVHGDIRNPEDLDGLPAVDLLIECSAEPSVHSGYDGGARYLINTNLSGTFNCLEYARRHGTAIVFLSTSRVYSIPVLRGLPLRVQGQRFVLPEGEGGPGWSERGIAEDFPTTAPRSLYGASKLGSELLIEEYNAGFGLPTIINRCGVLTGPWQMGKVDQGFRRQGPPGARRLARGRSVRADQAADRVLRPACRAQLQRRGRQRGQRFAGRADRSLPSAHREPVDTGRGADNPAHGHSLLRHRSCGGNAGDWLDAATVG